MKVKNCWVLVKKDIKDLGTSNLARIQLLDFGVTKVHTLEKEEESGRRWISQNVQSWTAVVSTVS